MSNFINRLLGDFDYLRGNTVMDDVEADSVSAGEINSTEYVGPTDNLQSAIENLSDNTRLIVEPGTYDTASGIDAGEQTDVEIVFQPGAVLAPTHADHVIMVHGNRNWTIKNLQVDGANKDPDSAVCQITDVYRDSENVTFVRPRFENVQGVAFNVRFTGAGETCRLIDPRAHCINHSGFINLFEGGDLTVRGGMCYGDVDAGIDLKANQRETYDVTVEGTVIRDASSGIGFGTEGTNPIHNVSVRNVVCREVVRPVFFKMTDGGTVENADVSVQVEDPDGVALKPPITFRDGGAGATYRDLDVAVKGTGRFAQSVTGEQIGIRNEDAVVEESEFSFDWRLPAGANGNAMAHVARCDTGAEFRDCEFRLAVTAEEAIFGQGVKWEDGAIVDGCYLRDTHISGMGANAVYDQQGTDHGANFWYIGSHDGNDPSVSSGSLDVQLVDGTTDGTF